MKKMSRKEKILLYRGIIQTIGLMILIIGMVWMISRYNERKIMGECIFTLQDGTEEHTGLYGNCTWINRHFLGYTPLQNEDNVKPFTKEDS